MKVYEKHTPESFSQQMTVKLILPSIVKHHKLFVTHDRIQIELNPNWILLSILVFF